MRQLYRAVLLTEDHHLLGYLEPGAKLMEHAEIGHHRVQGIERLLGTPARLVWAGRHTPRPPDCENLYETAASVAALVAPEHGPVGRYLLNHDHGVFVDKATVLENEARHRIHPLPLLTAEPVRTPEEHHIVGDHTLVGSWARALISVCDTVPAGFDQLKFDLTECPARPGSSSARRPGTAGWSITRSQASWG